MISPTRTLTLAKQKVQSRRTRRPWGAILLFLGPAMIYYLIFTIYPFFASLYYSVNNMTPVSRQAHHHLRRAAELRFPLYTGRYLPPGGAQLAAVGVRGAPD